MRIAVATFHVPHPQGSAAGRQLWALAEELRAGGHELTGWCWGPVRPGLDPPAWCEHRPFAAPRGWRQRPRNLLLPRGDVGRAGWSVPEGFVGWADDWSSWPAVEHAAGAALLTLHYDVGLDVRALGRWSPPLVQDWRAYRRAVRRSPCTVALSRRVASAAGVRTVVPATVPMPDSALPLREAPTALLLADFTWAPNAAALERLVRIWPQLRRRVPGAELLVAGRGSTGLTVPAGIRVLGEVTATTEAMALAAVLAFPCPATSGPKLKVLDAVAAGLPVVTTAAGVEGLTVPDDSVAVADDHAFASVLGDVLLDPERRARMATTARAAALRHHAPAVAATARLDAIRTFGHAAD